MITVLGWLFLAGTVGLLIARRAHWIVALLAAAVAFPHSAAIVVAGASLSCFHLLAAICSVRLLLLLRSRAVRATLRAREARLPLLLIAAFIAYGLAVTALGPALFAGIPVYASRGGIDQQATAMTPLHYTVSNAAQVLYLLLDTGAMLLVAVEARRWPHLFEISIATATALGFIRFLLPASFVDPFLDTMTNVSYFTVAQDDRSRGTFSEASLFGLFLLAALAYLVAALIRASPKRLVVLLPLLALTVVDLVLNRSGTVLLALPATLAVVLLVLLLAWVRRGRHAQRGILAGAAVALTAALLVSPLGAPLLTEMAAKAGTQSFANRTKADARSLELFVQTFGLGTGLGSNRSSSLIPTLLSTVGAFGTLAILTAVVLLIAGGLMVDLAAPDAWAAVGALGAYATSVPDLSFPVLWILAGALLAQRLARSVLDSEPVPERGRHRLRPSRA